MSLIDKCSDEEFIKIVEETDTYKDIALKLGYNSYNSTNEPKIKNRINKLNLDTSKFKNTTPTKTIIYNIKDEDFIKIVEETETYTEIALKLGYDKYDTKLGIKIKNKINKLNLSLKQTNTNKSLIDNFSDEEFIKIVKESDYLKDIALKIGYKLSISGGVHQKPCKKIKKRIEELKIDTKHFKYSERRELEFYLVENSTYCKKSSNELKKRLIKEGYMKDICDSCNIGPLWKYYGKEQKLVLQLEHINGNHTDNRIENLIPLCPNCHSCTSTFGGRNRKKKDNVKKKSYPTIGYKNIHEHLIICEKKKCNQLIKKRLIEEKLLEDRCHSCGIGNKWKFYGKEVDLTLQVDHINGNPLDNRLHNIRLLCYSCHSQSSTFAGKVR